MYASSTLAGSDSASTAGHGVVSAYSDAVRSDWVGVRDGELTIVCVDKSATVDEKVPALRDAVP
jgi:hypothetical protein